MIKVPKEKWKVEIARTTEQKQLVCLGTQRAKDSTGQACLYGYVCFIVVPI